MSDILTKYMQEKFEIDPLIVQKAIEIDKSLEGLHQEIKEIQEINSMKVLDAMRESRLSDNHFSWNTGYGYNDIGREKAEEIYTRIFNSEDSIVRPTIANGTHALALCLEGVLNSDYELISISGKPYDTLDKTIGISDSYNSLIKRGVDYTQIELLEDGSFDVDSITSKIQNSQKKKMVYCRLILK